MDQMLIETIITSGSGILGAILAAWISSGRRVSVPAVAIWAGIGGVLGAFVGYFLVTFLFLSPCAPLAPTSITITTPVEGGNASQSTIVRGTACHIPPNKKLWLFVTQGGVTLYYPQPGGPIQVSSDGKWNRAAFLGQPGSIDVGKEFVVYATLVDGEGEVPIQHFFDVGQRSGKFIPLDPLPEGIDIVSQVRVIRI